MEVLQNLARIVKGYWEIFIGGNNHSKGVANLMRKEWGLRLKKKMQELDCILLMTILNPGSRNDYHIFECQKL